MLQPHCHTIHSEDQKGKAQTYHLLVWDTTTNLGEGSKGLGGIQVTLQYLEFDKPCKVVGSRQETCFKVVKEIRAGAKLEDHRGRGQEGP